MPATAESPPEVEPEAGDDFPPFHLPVDLYLKMVDAGIFEQSKVFLWRGRLVEPMGKGRPHAFAALKLFPLLLAMMLENYHVEFESGIVIGGDSMPEPDLAVIRGTLDDYLARHPSARDVALLVEVADSSLRIDSSAKLRAYAADSIPVYWIINISARRIEVYSQPSGPGATPRYGERQDYAPGSLVPVVVDGAVVGEVAAAEILP